MNIKDYLERLRATRKAKAAELEKIQQKAMDEDRTKDEGEREQYKSIGEEIEALDLEIKDLEALEKMQVDSATPVDPTTTNSKKKGTDVRTPGNPANVRNTEKLEPGIRFARYVMAMANAKGDPSRAFAVANSSYVKNDDVLMSVLKAQRDSGQTAMDVIKANVNGGTTQDSTWAAPLVQYQDFAGDFVEYLRPQTIIGQFGVGNVPGLRRVPFNIRIPAQTSGGSASWVGEGKPKPLTKFDFTTATLQWTKIAAIAVITEELARFSSPSAEMLVRDGLRDAVVARMDIDFVDPGKAAVANVSPASITNGVAGLSSTGSDADAIRADIRRLWAPFIAANNPPRQAVYIMTATTALALSLLLNTLGQREFPDISINGGTLGGIPVIVSEYLDNAAGSAGGIVILANASDIYLADDGQVTVDASREASLQMDDAPTNTADTGAEQALVSMWQTNSIAIRAERYVHWKLRRSTGVQWLDAVSWGQ